nr:MATE family efflux transporter [Myxococcota bacterium]
MSSPASGGWRNRDHTRGRLSVSLLVLALPILATSLAGVVYQLVDLGFVSRLGEEATTGVIVANQSIRQIVFMLMLGLGVGVQTTISQAIGAGRSDDADHVAGQALV